MTTSEGQIGKGYPFDPDPAVVKWTCPFRSRTP